MTKADDMTNAEETTNDETEFATPPRLTAGAEAAPRRHPLRVRTRIRAGGLQQNEERGRG